MAKSVDPRLFRCTRRGAETLVSEIATCSVSGNITEIVGQKSWQEADGNAVTIASPTPPLKAGGFY